MIAWLLIQAASILFPTFEAPAWVMKVFVAAVALGFPVALVLAWAFELTPKGIKLTEQVPEEASISKRTGRRIMWAAALLALIAVAVFFAGRFVGQRSSSGAPTASSDKSTAVLPFVDLSQAKDQEYFCDGVSAYDLYLRGDKDQPKPVSSDRMVNVRPFCVHRPRSRVSGGELADERRRSL